MAEIYAEEKLDPKLRELIILVVSTTNQTYAEVKLHTNAALQSGVTPQQIQRSGLSLWAIYRPEQNRNFCSSGQ